MRQQKGFSLIELLIVVAIILIIAAIAIPSLLRSKIAANQSAAVSGVRTLNTAEVTYQTYYPGTGYANSLGKLGPGGLACVAPHPDATNACIVDAILGCVAQPCPKGAYQYQISTSAAVGGVFPDFVISAVPLNMGMTSPTADYCSTPDLILRGKPDPTGVGPIVLTVAGCNGGPPYTPLGN
jgi:prepilin-type N-terminal cleavage/methylation domain-containing protein